MPAWLIPALIAAATTVGTTAYSSNKARKAQKRAREDANLRELIEGAAPNISAVSDVIPEDVQGTDVGGLERALAAMEYGEEVPLPAAEMDPMANLSEEELAALLEESGLAGQLMASGGPVGTPEDVYYFSVPQVMGMMQDPNPQVQGVGMQLADMMASTPGMDMVPATRGQIEGMATGGAVTAKKFEMGGMPEYTPELDADFIAQQEALEELLELNELVDQGVISEARAEYDRQRLSGQAFPRKSQLDKAFPDTEKNLKGLKNFLRNKMSEGGPISEERLNNQRLR